MIKINEKKGEITTKQIVTLIILILSFSVILFLIFKLNLGQITNEEICRNSVILKGQSALGKGNLDCRTSYVCISGSGKGNCEGINPTKTIEVDVDSVKAKEQVMKALAEEMVSCWRQFGEGEINYGRKSPFEGPTEYAICSTVAFDERVRGEVFYIGYDEFYDYLRRTKKTDSQSYLQYLYSTNILEGLDDEEHFDFSFVDDIDTSRKYSIITGIDNKAGTAEKFRPDDILKVYIIPTSEISSRLDSSREFITKA